MGTGIMTFLRSRINQLLVANKQKIFCIGRNKTGTTSLKTEFENRGYIVGNQTVAEKTLVQPYFNNDFDSLINYCKTAQVFQDVPFSWPDTYKHLYESYPNSKFILTIRDSSDQWYNSITKFHSKIINGGSHLPTADELKNYFYKAKGFLWESNQNVYHTPENDPYNKDIFIKNYEQHNADVQSFFKNKKDQLLVINVAEKESYTQFCEFLNIPQTNDSFPWENKT